MTEPATAPSTTRPRPSERITAEVTSWPGVEAGPGRRGEFAFKVGRREIGHLHGDRSAHFVFPRDVWTELHTQGRVVHHPVFPDREGPAARRIQTDEDVRDVIALMRLNYARAVAHEDGTEPNEIRAYDDARLEPILDGLHATAPAPLSFAPSLRVRAFVLERERGNLLLYTAPRLDAYVRALSDLGGVGGHYLNHGHEAMFLPDSDGPPVFVHGADSAAVARRRSEAKTFSDRHSLDDDFEVIPTPGHTPGATAYLWNRGGRRFLFTGDTLMLRDGEWVPALLDSSDRRAFIASLELIRELDFDVLVPWAAGADDSPYAETDSKDARQRIDTILARLGDRAPR